MGSAEHLIWDFLKMSGKIMKRLRSVSNRSRLFIYHVIRKHGFIASGVEVSSLRSFYQEEYL